jgi:hypothetical protein
VGETELAKEVACGLVRRPGAAERGVVLRERVAGIVAQQGVDGGEEHVRRRLTLAALGGQREDLVIPCDSVPEDLVQRREIGTRFDLAPIAEVGADAGEVGHAQDCIQD